MSVASLEKAIVAELRELTKRKNLRLKDLHEWSNSEERVRKNLQEDEEAVFCPQHGVWCAISKS